MYTLQEQKDRAEIRLAQAISELRAAVIRDSTKRIILIAEEVAGANAELSRLNRSIKRTK